jgi:hypothetical protein
MIHHGSENSIWLVYSGYPETLIPGSKIQLSRLHLVAVLVNQISRESCQFRINAVDAWDPNLSVLCGSWSGNPPVHVPHSQEGRRRDSSTPLTSPRSTSPRTPSTTRLRMLL